MTFSLVQSFSCSFIPTISSLSQNLSEWVNPHQQLRKEAIALIDKVAVASIFKLEDSDLAIMKKAVGNAKHLMKGEFKEKLLALSPAKFQGILSQLLENDITFNKSILALLQLLGRDDLLKVAGLTAAQKDKIIKTQAILKNQVIRNVLHTRGKALWQEIIPDIIALLHHFMEIVITLTGFNQIGAKAPNRYSGEGEGINQYEAQSKVQLYTSILAFPPALFGFLYAYALSAATAAVLAATTIVAMVACMAIYTRFLRPCPRQCPGLENLTTRMLRKEEDPVFMRKDLITKIEDAFRAGKGALLVGEPGVGKSSVVLSLAERIAAGRCADHLKTALVFQSNSGQVRGHEYQLIAERYKHHVKNVVFFLDELQAAFDSTGIEGNDRSHALLTFCDQFPYVITATTTTEYEKYIEKIPAFKRRFVEITVTEPTPKEIEISLSQFLQKKAPELMLGAGVILYIIEQAKTFNSKTSCVDAAHSLLARAVVNAQELSFPTQENQIHQLEMEIEYMETSLFSQETMLESYSEQNSEMDTTVYDQKKVDLKAKKTELEALQSRLKRLRKVEEVFLKVKKGRYLLASKVETDKTQEHLTTQWARQEVFGRILAQFIQREKRALGLPAMLDKDLIDAILKQNKFKRPNLSRRNSCSF